MGMLDHQAIQQIVAYLASHELVKGNCSVEGGTSTATGRKVTSSQVVYESVARSRCVASGGFGQEHLLVVSLLGCGQRVQFGVS